MDEDKKQEEKPWVYGGSAAHKLSIEARHEVCRLIAEYTPPSLIKSYLKEYYGVSISDSVMHHYRTSKRWAGLIITLRSYFMANIEQIPMSHKSVRVARLETLFIHAVAQNEIRTAVSILRQAQTEMEGLKITVGDKQYSPAVNMTDTDIAQILHDAKAQGIEIAIPGNGKLKN